MLEQDWDEKISILWEIFQEGRVNVCAPGSLCNES